MDINELVKALQLVIQNAEDTNNSDLDSDTDSDTDSVEHHEDHDSILSCPHYMRGCDLFAECCQQYFPCRLCHDENKYEKEFDIKKQHQMDRFKVNKIRCRKCTTEQPVSNHCINCHLQFGNYYCAECRLFDYTDKKQFHCDKCKTCRTGNFEYQTKHCNKCNFCHIDKPGYKCVDDCAHNSCPVCMDDLFISTRVYCSLSCGHLIHADCLQMVLKNDYRCPICKKSITNTSMYFAQLESHISNNPMPEQYVREANIYCNDCEKHSTVQFHFIAMKCQHCNSYNTCE